MDFSSGELRTYATCPQQYRFKHVVGYPADRDFKNAFVGGVLSRVVDAFYRLRLWRQGPDALDALEAKIPWAVEQTVARDMLVWESPEEEILYTARAVTMLPTVIETIKREKLLGEVNRSEHELEMPFGEHVLHGRADLIVSRSGVLTVLDGKAGGTTHVSTDQLRFYALGVQKDPRFQRLPDRAGFWFYKRGTIVWKRLTPGTLQKFWETMTGDVQRIVAGVFPVTPGTCCKFCDYRMRCEEGQAYLLEHRAETRVPCDGSEGELSL